MFYEEKWIDGILHFRTKPDDEFSPASQQLLSAKLAALRGRVAEFEARLSLLPDVPVSSAMRREWERHTLRPFDGAAEEAFRAMLRAALEEE